MKILVTGANGFVGSQVARALVHAGHEVRASVRPGSSLAAVEDVATRIEWVPLDLFSSEPDVISGLARGVECGIHLAWYAVPGQYLASPENLRCVSGSLRLLEALAAEGCRRAVFVGSCFEYDFEPGILTETGPVRPQSLYAAAKLSTALMGEHLARLRKIEFAWARLFYLYGPNEDGRRLVPSVIDSMLAEKPVDLTKGTQVRDFLHVADVGAAISAIAASDLTGVVNVGSGQKVTVRDIVATIESHLGRTGLARFGARPENPTDPPVVVADNRKLVHGTSWAPAYDLVRGLEQTIEWAKARHATR